MVSYLVGNQPAVLYNMPVIILPLEMGDFELHQNPHHGSVCSKSSSYKEIPILYSEMLSYTPGGETS